MNIIIIYYNYFKECRCCNLGFLRSSLFLRQLTICTTPSVIALVLFPILSFPQFPPLKRSLLKVLYLIMWPKYFCFHFISHCYETSLIIYHFLLCFSFVLPVLVILKVFCHSLIVSNFKLDSKQLHFL